MIRLGKKGVLVAVLSCVAVAALAMQGDPGTGEPALVAHTVERDGCSASPCRQVAPVVVEQPGAISRVEPQTESAGAPVPSQGQSGPDAIGGRFTPAEKRSVALVRAKRLAAAKKLDLPNLQRFSPETEREIVRAYDDLMVQLREVDRNRIPIINEIVDRKVAAGMIEPVRARNEPVAALSSAADKTAAVAKVGTGNQRKPTRPRQTVVTRTGPAGPGLVRVDADEDCRLQVLYERIEEADATFLARVTFVLESAR